MSRACRCWRRWPSIFFFLATPLTNAITRSAEHQADIFGLDAVRKPDAFATVMLKLSTYRKLEPGQWEEIIFYDHPSGRTRIHGRDGVEEGAYPRRRHPRHGQPGITIAMRSAMIIGSCSASAA